MEAFGSAIYNSVRHKYSNAKRRGNNILSDVHDSFDFCTFEPQRHVVMMKRVLLSLAFVALFLLPISSFAQTAPFPDSGGTPCGPPFGPPCPIDGGVSLLVAAGVALGGKKAYQLYKKGE
jgi:hypothetical protein